MHNFKKAILLTVTLFATSSCGQKLREDIADFIKDFSLTNAMNSVKKGHYIDSSTGQYSGSPCSFLDEVSFDLTVDNEVSFYHRYKTVNYGTMTTSDYTEEVKTEDGVYTFTYTNHLTSQTTSNELTYQNAVEKTKRFFYSIYYEDTNYHVGGMYYGDMINAEAYKQQQFVTISEDKKQYQYLVENYKDTFGTIHNFNYKVNRLGMLISLEDSGHREDSTATYYSETITVTY